MRVLVCGDRDWGDVAIIEMMLSGYADFDDLVVIEGDARGADRIAGQWARFAGVDNETYPANWSTHHRAAGPIRNQQMLEEGKPEVVLAFHDNLAASKGTADMVRRARKAGIPVYVIGHAQ